DGCHWNGATAEFLAISGQFLVNFWQVSRLGKLLKEKRKRISGHFWYFCGDPGYSRPFPPVVGTKRMPKPPRRQFRKFSMIPAVPSLALLLFPLGIAAPAQGFDLQGHRGTRGLMPENTLAAFRKAMEIGVTTLETALAVTRDGPLVLSHEPLL